MRHARDMSWNGHTFPTFSRAGRGVSDEWKGPVRLSKTAANGLLFNFSHLFWERDLKGLGPSLGTSAICLQVF